MIIAVSKTGDKVFQVLSIFSSREDEEICLVQEMKNNEFRLVMKDDIIIIKDMEVFDSEKLNSFLNLEENVVVEDVVETEEENVCGSELLEEVPEEIEETDKVLGENLEHIDEVLYVMKEVMRVKNLAYGDSFFENFSKNELDYLLPRVREKLARVENLSAKDFSEENISEGIIDSLLDTANYLALALNGYRRMGKIDVLEVDDFI